MTELTDPVWLSVERAPALGLDDLHVWSIDLTMHAIDMQQPLSQSEIERAARFRFDEDRDRYRRTRTSLRLLLGHYAACRPERVIIREGNGDKPTTGSAAIEFNVSHSAGRALIAFRRERGVGVDIEQLRPIDDRAALAARYFCHEECMQIADTAERLADLRFLMCWTRKEAYLKATGTGLRSDPILYNVGATARMTRLDDISVNSFSCGDGAIGAIAQYEPAAEPVFLSFDAIRIANLA